MRNLVQWVVPWSLAALMASCGKSGGHPTGSGAGGAGGGTGSSSSSSATMGTGASGPAPIAGLALFYTDLTSGPAGGGQDDKGAFVTVYGNGFGDSRGSATITIGGGEADNYPIWTNTKITFQLGSAAKTGDIVVHVPNKGDSNGLPFTVRTGKIYFVTGSGDDSKDGSFAHPWKTIPQAKNSLQPGDIAYLGTSAGDMLSQTTLDDSSPYKCALGMSYNDGANAGTADAPKALVAYPGATALIGAESGLERGLLVPAIDGTFDYWVIAGLTLRGTVEALDMEGQSIGWRVIGNDISCPNGTGLSGCVTGFPDHLIFYGNVVHDAAGNVPKNQITKYYHGIYFGGSNHFDLGWNVVRDGNTCRGIQFHDSEGPNNYDIVVHDNLIHGTTCDGLNFATVDPSQGRVEAYNNVIYDVGRGPDPQDGSSNYACIYIANITNHGAEGSGNVKIYNNTLYDCGSRANSAAGAVARADGPVGIEMSNNLILVRSGESYFSSDTEMSLISGSNNLFFGAGAPPAGLTASVGADPLLVSPSTLDLHLGSGSPAIDQGVMTPAVRDFDGNPRPQGQGFDIGAYEHVP